jgi:hypothetical protein
MNDKTAKNTKNAATTETKTPKARTPRVNLDVPYPARAFAKACGAYWDAKRKVWYTYAGSHTARALARFAGAADRKAYGL